MTPELPRSILHGLILATGVNGHRNDFNHRLRLKPWGLDGLCKGQDMYSLVVRGIGGRSEGPSFHHPFVALTKKNE